MICVQVIHWPIAVAPLFLYIPIDCEEKNQCACSLFQLSSLSFFHLFFMTMLLSRLVSQPSLSPESDPTEDPTPHRLTT